MDGRGRRIFLDTWVRCTREDHIAAARVGGAGGLDALAVCGVMVGILGHVGQEG